MSLPCDHHLGCDKLFGKKGCLVRHKYEYHSVVEVTGAILDDAKAKMTVVRLDDNTLECPSPQEICSAGKCLKCFGT